MNNKEFKKTNSKVKAIISVIAILLVVTLSLGSVTYFYKDEAAALVSSIPVLKNLFSLPIVEEPLDNEPNIEEPILEEPMKVYTSTPFVVGERKDPREIYINKYDFESVVSNNINDFMFFPSSKNGMSHVGSFFHYNAYRVFYETEKSPILSELFFSFSVITFDKFYEYYKNPYMNYNIYMPNGISNDDFILFLYIPYYNNKYKSNSNFISMHEYDDFYSGYCVLYSTVDIEHVTDEFSMSCSKGFNAKYVADNGLVDYKQIFGDFTDEITNGYVVEGGEARYIKKQALLDKTFGSTPFKAV